MSRVSRREWLTLGGIAAFSALSGAVGGYSLIATRSARAADPPREIAIQAQRFRYTPDEITLQAGEAVVLAVIALDFTHGFHIPDLGLRADLLQGQVTRITLPPLQAGTIEFLCDNFCGEGHEQMHGRLLVSA